MPRHPIACSAEFDSAIASAPSASALIKSAGTRSPRVTINVTSPRSQRSRCAQAYHDPGVDRLIVEQRRAMELGGEHLDIIPARQCMAGHAHCRHRPVVAGLVAAMFGQRLDRAHVKLRSWSALRVRLTLWTQSAVERI